jgi:hypothetical protein
MEHHVDVFQRLVLAVEEVEMFHLSFYRRGLAGMFQRGLDNVRANFGPCKLLSGRHLFCSNVQSTTFRLLVLKRRKLKLVLTTLL